jgi:histidine triad (HIT) family protein
MNCIFCQIVAGNAPASLLHQDERCVVFLDIQPVNPGHLLVVPRQHAVNLAALDPEDGAHLFQVGQQMAQALRCSGLRCEGVNLFLADGVAAGQEVPHVHLHVFPRFAGDGFGMKFNPRYFQRPSREELENVAVKIKAGRSIK